MEILLLPNGMEVSVFSFLQWKLMTKITEQLLWCVINPDSIIKVYFI